MAGLEERVFGRLPDETGCTPACPGLARITRARQAMTRTAKPHEATGG